MSLIGWSFTSAPSNLILCVLMAALATAAMEAVVAASSVTVEKVDTIAQPIATDGASKNRDDEFNAINDAAAEGNTSNHVDDDEGEPTKRPRCRRNVLGKLLEAKGVIRPLQVEE